MVFIKGKCQILLIYVLCCLTVILGAGSQVICYEKKTTHLQLNDCFPFQTSDLSAKQLLKKEVSTGTDNNCPSCFDTHISILSKKNISSSLLPFNEVGNIFFTAYQHHFDPFTSVKIPQQQLSVILPQTASLAAMRTTVLLI